MNVLEYNNVSYCNACMHAMRACMHVRIYTSMYACMSTCLYVVYVCMQECMHVSLYSVCLYLCTAAVTVGCAVAAAGTLLPMLV